MRTRVFYNLPASACYGCQACAQICPTNAIGMISDKEGFLYPKINSSKCIECNLCEKSCPTQEATIEPLFYPVPQTVDAAWEKNLADRLESTSGGGFFVMAKKWIHNGGVVYGVDFDDNMNVLHTRVSTLERLKRLRGSKYVQSDLSGILQEVKEDLQSGNKVLFSGTPCQVAGLRTYLKKDYVNLVTIDLVCHGVPSPLFFKEHLHYLENGRNKKIIDYKFRSKRKSGWRSYIKYIFENRCVEAHFWGDDFYAQCFYKSCINRISCYTCRFSCENRVGDITLSDFWNSEKFDRRLRLERKYGYNMVMCNTPKGKDLYESVRDEMEAIQVPVKVAIDGDVRLRHPEAQPVERDSIFDEYYQHGYAWLKKKRFKKSSKINSLVPTWIKNLFYDVKAHI